MIRDKKMQALVAQNKEPITPLLYRIRELYEQYGVSTVIVMGGSGDYFDIADTVIMMDEYIPKDVTKQAKALSNQEHQQTTASNKMIKFQLASSATRRPGEQTLNAARNQFAVKIDVREANTILYGEHRIDLSQVEQLIDIGQTRTIGLMIQYYADQYAHKPTDTKESLTDNLKEILCIAKEEGLDTFSPYKVGNLALPRLYELCAAINRIRCDDWTT